MTSYIPASSNGVLSALILRVSSVGACSNTIYSWLLPVHVVWVLHPIGEFCHPWMGGISMDGTSLHNIVPYISSLVFTTNAACNP